MNTQSVILFDGVCNLCNGAVNFIIKRDKKKLLKFSPLQSNTGKQLLRQFHLHSPEMTSIVLIENSKAYTRSTAALKACRYLNGVWPLLYIFIIVPKFIRDGVYDFIGNRRYKWFGIKENCMVPTPDTRSRFLL